MNAASFQQRFDDARPFAPVPLDGGRSSIAAANITATPFSWPDPTKLPRRPWVWGRWLLRCTVAAIVAPGGVGKSSFVASMLLALASGRDEILGKTVWAGPKTVWYWNLEDTMDELQMQLTAAAMFHGVTQAQCGNRIYLDSGPEGNGLCIAVKGADECEILAPVVDAVVHELITKRIGTNDLAVVPASALAAGLEHMRVDLGLEKDRSRRFALWTLLHSLGAAPDLDVAFKDPADRDAARNWMDLSERLTSDE